MAGHTQERLAQKTGLAGDRHKADRVEPVLHGKSLGFVQRFAGDGGDVGLCPVGTDVDAQVIHRIGCRPVEGGKGGGPAALGVDVAAVDGQIADLFVGNDQLAAHAARFKIRGGLAQGGQFRGHVFGGKRDFADHAPASRCTVQQADAVKRQA